ncbi:MAG: hypothetical protein B7Z16_16530, partial [Algoriphagus sp. 32-45-6]
GKSVIEEVKSPMYATTVGLVLAGFKSIDNREDEYNKRRANTGHKPKIMKTREAVFHGFFKNITEKMKTFINADIGEDDHYK